MRWITDNRLETARNIFLFGIFPALVVVLLIGFLWSTFLQQTNLTVISIQPLPGRLEPGESIQVTFSQDPSKCTPVIDSIDTNNLTLTRTEQNELIITPYRSIWPLGQTITLRLECVRNGAREFTWQVTPLESLTPRQEAELQSILDVAVADANREYHEQNPFVASFPIRRETYVMRFLEAERIIYLFSEQTFTAQEKEAIRQTERPALDELGVPADIPIVFSDEYNN